MIPTIETIVEDLAAGAITKQQAIAWLNLHAEGAANDLRDHFASLAMNAMVSQPAWKSCPSEKIAAWAYEQADAMMLARGSGAQQ